MLAAPPLQHHPSHRRFIDRLTLASMLPHRRFIDRLTLASTFPSPCLIESLMIFGALRSVL
ncbi:MAG TPA: hypothetical protein V6C84_16180 [Coleofasciculaceae cyanobacterium]